MNTTFLFHQHKSNAPDPVRTKLQLFLFIPPILMLMITLQPTLVAAKASASPDREHLRSLKIIEETETTLQKENIATVDLFNLRLLGTLASTDDFIDQLYGQVCGQKKTLIQNIDQAQTEFPFRDRVFRILTELADRSQRADYKDKEKLRRNKWSYANFLRYTAKLDCILADANARTSYGDPIARDQALLIYDMIKGYRDSTAKYAQLKQSLESEARTAISQKRPLEPGNIASYDILDIQLGMSFPAVRLIKPELHIKNPQQVSPGNPGILAEFQDRQIENHPIRVTLEFPTKTETSRVTYNCQDITYQLETAGFTANNLLKIFGKLFSKYGSPTLDLTYSAQPFDLKAVPARIELAKKYPVRYCWGDCEFSDPPSFFGPYPAGYRMMLDYSAQQNQLRLKLNHTEAQPENEAKLEDFFDSEAGPEDWFEHNPAPAPDHSNSERQDSLKQQDHQQTNETLEF
ncbi:MAG: hypothetical protein MI864_11920 [Pseudomonadales bacterium]|nr:hypothetical protein [Pseudomonadales bacterium]